MIRVAIADDHALVRGGLGQVLATTEDLCLEGEAASGEELLQLLSVTPCDLVLLDLSMPGWGGMVTIRHLREKFPVMPVVVLSMHNEGPLVARALEAGADGYVAKDSEPEILLEAIRQVGAGGHFVDPSVQAAAVASSLESGGGEEALSLRERAVLELIAAGCTLTDIAISLAVSPKTVSTYKMRLMQKLAIDNNADLVRYAIYLENRLT